MAKVVELEEEVVLRPEPILARRALASRAEEEEEAMVPSTSDAKAGRDREGPLAREGPVARKRGFGVVMDGASTVIEEEAVGASDAESLSIKASSEALDDVRESCDTVCSRCLRASLAAARFNLLASATSSDSSDDGEACVSKRVSERPCDKDVEKRQSDGEDISIICIEIAP